MLHAPGARAHQQHLDPFRFGQHALERLVRHGADARRRGVGAAAERAVGVEELERGPHARRHHLERPERVGRGDEVAAEALTKHRKRAADLRDSLDATFALQSRLTGVRGDMQAFREEFLAA